MSDPSPPSPAFGSDGKSDGRARPRWSIVNPGADPASITGLPSAGAIVGVSPPFAVSEPSSGSPVNAEPDTVPVPRCADVRTRLNRSTSAVAVPMFAPDSVAFGRSDTRSTAAESFTRIVSARMAVAVRVLTLS